MHDDFEKYRPGKGENLSQLNIRTSPGLAEQLRTFAEVENDSISALVTEGIARVIEDRMSHATPEMVTKLAERREAARQRVQAIDALLSADSTTRL